MVLPAANVQECLGHVAVLIDHVGQMVELVANLEVVRAPPTALEERHVLVELVVLVGVEQGKTEKVGSRGSAASLRQSVRQWIAALGAPFNTCNIGVIADEGGYWQAGDGIYSCSWRPIGSPHKVWSRRRPAKVVIVLKEVAEAGSGDDLRGEADVSAYVVGRVGGRPPKAV